MEAFFDGIVNADNQSIVIPSTTVTTNTTTVGIVLDMLEVSRLQDDIGFAFFVADRIDGVYTPLFEVSDDGVTFVPLSDFYLRYRMRKSTTLNLNNRDYYSYIDSGQEAAAALNVNGKSVIGAIKSKRYLRFSIVSTGVTSGAKISAVTSPLPAWQE